MQALLAILDSPLAKAGKLKVRPASLLDSQFAVHGGNITPMQGHPICM